MKLWYTWFLVEKKKSEIGELFVLTPPFLDISPPANIKMYVLRGHYIEVLFDQRDDGEGPRWMESLTAWNGTFESENLNRRVEDKRAIFNQLN